MTKVAELSVPGKDSIGQEITCLYGRKPPEFAVYRVPRRVMVHFADDAATADKQRKDLAQVAPLRGEIDGLIDGWREGSSRRLFGFDNSAKLHSKALRYDRRVGDALILALEGDVATAQLLLQKVREDILNERVAWARFEYLISAFLTALALMFAAWLLSAIYPLETAPDPEATKQRMAAIGVVILFIAAVAGVGVALAGQGSGDMPRHPAGTDGDGEGEADGKPLRDRILAGLLLFAIVAIPSFAILVLPSFDYAAVDRAYRDAVDMWRAAAAGSVGAFFSISLAIRGRTILPDLLRTSNVMDAVLRITIGFIAGAVVLALIREGVVTLSFGNGDGETQTILDVLIVGFLAGFSERLVPDLLGKAEFNSTDPSAIAPATVPPPQSAGPAAGNGGGTPATDRGPEAPPARQPAGSSVTEADEAETDPGRSVDGPAAEAPEPVPAQPGEDSSGPEISPAPAAPRSPPPA